MHELSSLRDVLNRNIIVFEKGTITSEIGKMCISKLNSGKDNGDIGFNTMISHGYTPTVLLYLFPKITRLLPRTLIIIEGNLFLI